MKKLYMPLLMLSYFQFLQCMDNALIPCDGPKGREIITTIKNNIECESDFYRIILDNNGTIFPYTQKCFEASAKLYNQNLTPDEVKQLFTEGAIVDFSITPSKDYGPVQQSPLNYWCCITKHNHSNRTQIVEQILKLGKTLDKGGALTYVIGSKNLPLTELILQYNPSFDSRTWHSALSHTTDSSPNKAYLDLLLKQATKDELTVGLIACFQYWFDKEGNNIQYQPSEMQQLIDCGANVNQGLATLICMLTELRISVNPTNSNVLKNIKFLCERGATNPTAVVKFRAIQSTFGTLADLLEKNTK